MLSCLLGAACAEDSLLCPPELELVPTFLAPLRRRATELSRFSEAGMIFLVFSEVPEMSSEVAGPGTNAGE